MRFSRCQRVLTRVALAALALCVMAPEAMAAKPSKPSRPGGFRLLSSALNIFQVNRVQCYVVSDGTNRPWRVHMRSDSTRGPPCADVEQPPYQVCCFLTATGRRVARNGSSSTHASWASRR